MSTVEIHDVLVDFLEVAIHNILCTRKLYPDAIFTPCKKYGVTVYQSEHPLLNEYIIQVLKAAQIYAKNNQLKQLLLCITNEKILVEKYVFDILLFDNKPADKDPLLVKLEQTLRTFCLKLTNSFDDLVTLTNNSEFEIILHTTELASVEFNEEQQQKEFPWLPVKQIELNSFGIVPLHSIDTDVLLIQIYLEEYSKT